MRIFIKVVVQFQVPKNEVQLKKRRKGKGKGKKEDLQGKKINNN